MDSVLKALVQDMEERGGIDLSECFIDGTFASAKKGGLGVGPTKRGKEPRSWQSWTATAFLSPYALEALRRMKSRS